MFILLISFILFTLSMVSNKVKIVNPQFYLFGILSRKMTLQIDREMHKYYGQTKYDSEINQYVFQVSVPDKENNLILDGPNFALPPGKYKVDFPIKIDQSCDHPLMQIDIEKTGKQLITQKVFDSNELSNSQWQTISIGFETDGGEEFRFPVYNFGDCGVSIGPPVLKIENIYWSKIFQKVPKIKKLNNY